MAARNLTKTRRKPPARSKPPFALEGIDHILLLVKGMKPAVRFYTDVLGCKIEGKLPQYGMLQLRAGSALIDLVDVSVPQAAWAVPPVAGGRNLDHFCITIDVYDESKIRAYLAARGVAIGEAGSRYGAEGEGPSLYINDPEGNVVELKGPPWQPGT